MRPYEINVPTRPPQTEHYQATIVAVVVPIKLLIFELVIKLLYVVITPYVIRRQSRGSCRASISSFDMLSVSETTIVQEGRRTVPCSNRTQRSEDVLPILE
jgi:hypothetical protein